MSFFNRFVTAALAGCVALLPPAPPCFGTNPPTPATPLLSPASPSAVVPMAVQPKPSTVLSGSDLLKGACAVALEKAASGASAAAPLKLALNGSLMGEKFLRDSRASAALLFLPDKAKVREITNGDWLAVPLAYQTIVIAVARENKLERLDLETLARIFGARQGEILRTWSEVKGSGLNLPIHPITTRYELSVSTPMFRNRVLHDQDFRANTTFFSSDGETATYLSGSPSSIGVFATPPEGTKHLRVLPLALSPTSPSAYLPTPESLHTGDYPLAMALHLVIPRRSLEAVRPFLPALLSDEFSESLRLSGFIPVEKKMRRNFQEALDKTR